jgi:sarcosine oxidase subunit gamma
MEVALDFGNAGEENRRKQILGVCDVSFLPRFGVKGLNVLQWLRANRLNVPAEPNTWEAQESGALLLRLGNSEFLLEDQPGGNACESLNAADGKSIHGLYKVLRNDASFILSGSDVLALFSELCSLDLRDKALAANGLVMTQVAGISATVVRQYLNGEPVYRLWCDGTYGPYMWETLMEIATEHGGGAVGASTHYTGVF